MPIRRADDTTYTLASNVSANGSAVYIKGGEYHFMAMGTPGGATVSLQVQMPDGATWTDVQVFTGSKVTFTVLPGNQSGVDLPAGNVRLGVTGGSPVGLYAWLVGLG